MAKSVLLELGFWLFMLGMISGYFSAHIFGLNQLEGVSLGVFIGFGFFLIFNKVKEWKK